MNMNLKMIVPALLLAAQGVFAAIQLDITGQDELQISDSAGKPVATIPAGELRKTVKADGHGFQASYGKNIHHKPLIIIYADPEDPKSLELQCRNHRVTVSKATLVIVLEDDGGLLLQFSVAGRVSIASPGGSFLRIYGHATELPDAPGQAKPDDRVRRELEGIINDTQTIFSPRLVPDSITPVTP